MKKRTIEIVLRITTDKPLAYARRVTSLWWGDETVAYPHYAGSYYTESQECDGVIESVTVKPAKRGRSKK